MPREKKTEDWLDLYTAFLDSLNRNLEKPREWFERLGITPGAEGVMDLPRAATQEKIDEQQNSWARVKRDIRVFGLELSEELELEPAILDPTTKPTSGQELVRYQKQMMAWEKDPWLHVAHRFEITPVRFKGRDALTALGFFMFWITQCNKVDPVEQTRKMLIAQGITPENFHLHADRLMIRNPWAPDGLVPKHHIPPSRN